MKNEMFLDLVVSCGMLMFLVLFCMVLCLMTSCTLSFSNISTHGTSSEVEDEDMKASPSTEINVPTSLIP